ncbi:MAG: Rsd/AlgQ family anti-sigma factor [Gammaproteobacteria bacterium]|nr:Rsd/AlgQ family anti-sigma factor [Gammaproteobacteria bacterium]
MTIDSIHSKAIPDLISKLLKKRQDVLVLLNRLATTKPEMSLQEIDPLLRHFCQMLVDYVALGHFEVYQCFEEIHSDTSRCKKIKKLACQLYPRIAETTHQTIAFNDHYDTPQLSLDSFREDLSVLGEQLATRIELEDRLIAAVNQQKSEGVELH